MAKKKASPKKKSCTKTGGKCPKKNCTEKKSSVPEFEVKPMKKSDYFFGLIKKAFGYE